MSDDRRVLATNRKARHVYHILEKETAGIELLGTEVKAAAGYACHDPVRRRRLLLNKREIERLTSKVQEKGLTVVPLSAFLEGNWIKIVIALVRGKQLHDKRETLRQRTLDREAEQAIKERSK